VACLRSLTHSFVARLVVQVLFQGAGAAARWVFILLFLVTLYWWFFFKKQDQVHSLLPGYEDRHA
jgi:hypothetical protein